MTSTTLSSKEFKSLFKWAFKRNRAVMIIFSIFLGIGLILDLYILAMSGMDDAIAPATILIFGCMAAFFTYVSSLKTFSFLHNKRSVDMFGALPTTRATMLVSHLLAGISTIAAPLTIASILVLGVTALSGEYFGSCVFMMFANLLMICAAYTFTALVAYCCGTVIDTAVVTFISNCIWVAVVCLFYGMAAEMIPGFSDWEVIINTPFFTAFAPYAFGLINAYFIETSNATTIIASVAWNILFTVGAFYLTLYVAKKRKAESSQNGFAFPWLPMIIKAGASVAAGSFIGFIAAETAYKGFGNMFIFAFWYVIIAFVAFFVLHLIFARGLKGKFLPSAIVFGGTTVAALAVVFSMTTGLGIDTYVPNPDTIKSVTFDYVEFKDPENIKTVTEIHQVIVDGLREEIEYPYYIGSADDYHYSYYYDDYAETNTVTDPELAYYYSIREENFRLVNDASFDLNYNKKVGFETSRYYYITSYSLDDYYSYDLDKLEELIQKLYNSEEYKASRFPEIWSEENRENLRISDANLRYYVRLEDSYGGYSDDFSSIGFATLPTDEAFMSGLYEALKADIIADEKFPRTTGYVYDKTVFHNQYIDLSIQYIDTTRNHGRGFYSSQSYDSSVHVYIKEDYKNTHDYLDKNGIEITKSSTLNSGYTQALYFQDYISFGFGGDYSYFKSFVDDMALAWEYNACTEFEEIDYEAWHKEYYSDYFTALHEKAVKLYVEYSSDDKYFDPNYTNDYMEETGEYGDYFQLEDKLIEQLIVFSNEYVEGTLDDSGKASDTSDIDSNTNSDTQSEVESTAEDNSDTASAADNSKENTSAA